MNLTRQHLAFLITLFSMGIVILVLYNIHLGKAQETADDYVVEMVLDEELEELLEQMVPEERKTAPSVKSHMAYNESAKPSYGEPEPLKTLDELLAEKAAENESPDDPSNAMGADYIEKVKALAKEREEKKQLLGEKDADKQSYTNNLAKRRTSVSYSLVDRGNIKLPPPIYTCIEGGKVVVNITVDAYGNVVHADFNAKSSDTSNGCLVDNAIAYALKARFTSAGNPSQKGSITYLFQGK